MAETRTRVSCQLDDCAALQPSLDLVYEDFWTDPAVRAPDPSFALSYSDLTTPAPTTLACFTDWSASCRVVVNYETHIHPLWSQVREVIDPNDGVTVLADHTCTQGGCHAPVDAMGGTAVPAAQLDLSDGLSAVETDHFNAYRELLFQDDGDAAPEPPMSAAGASASGAFFSVFDAGGTHEGRLSPAELRLIAEWLDVGAQYYNDPFDVPQD